MSEGFISLGCGKIERESVDLIVWEKAISKEQGELIIQFFLSSIPVIQRKREKFSDELCVNRLNYTELALASEGILFDDINLEIFIEPT